MVTRTFLTRNIITKIQASPSNILYDEADHQPVCSQVVSGEAGEKVVVWVRYHMLTIPASQACVAMDVRINLLIILQCVGARIILLRHTVSSACMYVLLYVTMVCPLSNMLSCTRLFVL